MTLTIANDATVRICVCVRASPQSPEVIRATDGSKHAAAVAGYY